MATMILSDLSDFYANTKVIMQILVAVAALIAAIRIYQRMQNGEQVKDEMIRWMVSICIAFLFFAAVEAYIGTGNFEGGGGNAYGGLGFDPFNTAFFYARETYQAALVFGVIYAIIGVIKVYLKFQNGEEDVYEYMVLWFGSLIFLFSLGWIINTTLGY